MLLPEGWSCLIQPHHPLHPPRNEESDDPAAEEGGAAPGGLLVVLVILQQSKATASVMSDGLQADLIFLLAKKKKEERTLNSTRKLGMIRNRKTTKHIHTTSQFYRCECKLEKEIFFIYPVKRFNFWNFWLCWVFGYGTWLSCGAQRELL